MSELQFPKDPIVGQQYDFPPYKYYWDGIKWKTLGIGYNPVNDLRDEVLPTTREAIRRSYAEAGLNLVDGSFELGGVLHSTSDVLLHQLSGKAYSWSGALPHVIAAGANPVGVADWVPQTDQNLRAELDSGYLDKFYAHTYDTVAAMRSGTHTVGDRVRWLGYYEPNDGGGNTGIVKVGAHTPDGGSIFSVDTNTYIEADIKTKSINVLMFGVDDGTNGGDPAPRLNNLIAFLKTAKQNKVKFNKGVTYPFSSRWVIDTPCVIDLRGATLTKTAANFEMIYGNAIGEGEVEFLNGVIDGRNMTNTFIHLLRFDDASANLSLKKMTIKNNLRLSLGIPVQDVDSDGVYVINANRLKVEGCTINGISRNGISVIDWCPTQIYRDNRFFDCYLYGVDAEPNSEAGIIYNHITFDNNDFLRCGPQGAGNYVWDFGGGAQVLSRHSIQIARQVTVVNNRVDMTESSMTNGDPVDGIRVDDTVTTQYSNNEFKGCKVLVNASGRTTGETATFSGNTFTEASLAVFKIRKIEGDSNPMAGSKASLVLDAMAAGDQNLIRWDGAIQNGGNSNLSTLASFASNNGKVKLLVSDSRTTNFPQSVVKHKGKVEFNLKCFGAFPLIVNNIDIGNIKFKGGEVNGAINFIGDGTARLDGLDIDGLKANLTGHFIQALTSGNNGNVTVKNCYVVATKFIDGRTFNGAIIKNNDYDGAAFYGEQAASSGQIIRDNNIKNASTRSIVSFSTDSAIGGNYSFNSQAYNINAASDIGDNIAK